MSQKWTFLRCVKCIYDDPERKHSVYKNIQLIFFVWSKIYLCCMSPCFLG